MLDRFKEPSAGGSQRGVDASAGWELSNLDTEMAASDLSEGWNQSE